MVTKEDLQAKYAGLSNQALMGILERKTDYTELAVEAATKELEGRKITPADIQSYEKGKEDKVISNYKNAVIDLSVWHKVLFYIVFIPVLRGAFKANFYEDGSLLKLKQASYFTYTSWGGILVAVFASLAFGAGDAVSLALWILCFIPSYLINEYSYKPKQLININRQFGV